MEILGVQCLACGAKRRHKSLRYHPDTFVAYCENPYICSEGHPNSPANMIKRQSQLHLVEYEVAKHSYEAGATVEKTDRVKRLLVNPLTVRITSVDMAQFLVEHSEITNQSISELVRGFIQTMMERYDTFDKRKPITQVKEPKKPSADIDDNDLVF